SVCLPVVSSPAIPTCAVDGELRRRAADSGVEIEAVNPWRNRLCLCWVDADSYVRRGSCGNGLDLFRVGTLTARIQGRDDIVVSGAIDEACVRETGAGRRSHL